MSTQKNESYRKNLIGVVHKLQHTLCIDEETYRDMLISLTGKNSCSALSITQLQGVVDYMNDKAKEAGLVEKTREKGQVAPGVRPEVKQEYEKQRAKIGAILCDLNKPWVYADRILQTMFGVAGISYANSQQLMACTTALIKQQAVQKKAV